ncbi:unnamed protein product, partial [Ectocarpus fasciculatus]
MGTDSPRTPLPLGQVMTVFMVQLCEGININVLFPFVAFMVEDFGYTGKELGYHVGALAATFCLAQFLSSVPWGALSDRVGRKPPVVLGVLGSAMGMVVLGFSETYGQAIAGRAISGLLTGNVGILKSFLAEITDDSNRGHGFSLMSLGWSLGTILGPLAGGLLSYPAVKYPTTFSAEGLFGRHPFLLPCLLCVGCNLMAGTLTLLVMEESRWKKERSVKDKETDPAAGPGYVWRAGAWLSRRLLWVERQQVYEELDTTEHAKADCDTGGGDSDSEDRIEEDSIGEDGATYHSDSSCEEEKEDVAGAGDLEMGRLRGGADAPPADGAHSPLVTREVALAVASYGLCAMGYIVVEETVPLMLKLDRAEGGLSYDSSEIGSVLAMGGFTMLLWTMFLLPKISHHSKLWLFRIANLASLPVALSYPALAAASGYIYAATGADRGREIIFALCVLITTVKNCLATMVFLSVMIFVNHSVEERQLGAVNGLGQMVAAGARAIGPAAGGMLWSLSAHLHF